MVLLMLWWFGLLMTIISTPYDEHVPSQKSLDHSIIGNI